MANEEDYLDLIIADELVESWLDIVSSSDSKERVKEAVEKLRECVERSEAYVEKALECKAVETLEGYLERSGEPPALLNDVKAILSILQDYTEKHGRITELKYGEYEIKIRQGALNDGLGARLWNVSHLLNQILVRIEDRLEEKKILEIGSGCGSCGILAAKLNPSNQVFLTDCESSVLQNLGYCCRLNYDPAWDEAMKSLELMEDSYDEGLDCYKEDAMENPLDEEYDWDFGNMSVRFLDWRAKPSEEASASEDLPPKLVDGDRFEVIIGCEVIYEEEHASLIASLMKERLDDNGRCLIAGAVREATVFSAFESDCQRLGLQLKKHVLKTSEECGMDVSEYEGGVAIMEIAGGSFSNWLDLASLTRGIGCRNSDGERNIGATIDTS